MVLLAVLIVVGVTIAARLIVPPYRRHRMAAELRRDWWPAFEREFRAYAGRAWAAAREAERNR